MGFSRQHDVALLRALFSQSGQRHSRDALARSTNLSVNEIDACLKPYIEAGYPIEFHPHGGISLHGPPDIWCAEEILARCPHATPIHFNAWNPLLLAETTSTNDVARDQARKGAPSGFVVAASHQTAGRGRLGRKWESPPDRGLYVSLVLRPDFALVEAGKLSILSSVATVDAVETVCGIRPQIKWPNDLILGGRKLAGLLIEAEHKGGRVDFAVVGIGLNVRHERKDFSSDVRELATSLYLATGHLYRRADILVALLQAFEQRLARPFAEVREAWTASSLTLGQRLTLATARGRKHGQVLGLDESGALLMRADSGEVEAVTAGDMQGY